jgi:hypothetical protein
MMQKREAAFKAQTGIDVHFGVGSYGNNQARAGLCYRISAASLSKDLIVQVVNQGGDVPDGNFDLQMGDGGYGIFDACVKDGTSMPQFDGTGSQWGNTYGGWDTRAQCSQLPQFPHCKLDASYVDNMQTLCQWSFDNGLRLQNGE